LAAGGIWAVLEFVVWTRLPQEFVGKWVVIEGQMKGTTMEFHRDGSLVGRSRQGDLEIVLEAQATVEGRMMFITSKNRATGQDEIAVHTIRALGPREMVLEDEEHQLLKLARVDE
jgi:uncharacterized protein (TIGR03066 family)